MTPEVFVLHGCTLASPRGEHNHVNITSRLIKLGDIGGIRRIVPAFSFWLNNALHIAAKQKHIPIITKLIPCNNSYLLPQTRSGNKLIIWEICLQNRTAVLKGLKARFELRKQDWSAITNAIINHRGIPGTSYVPGTRESKANCTRIPWYRLPWYHITYQVLHITWHDDENKGGARIIWVRINAAGDHLCNTAYINACIHTCIYVHDVGSSFSMTSRTGGSSPHRYQYIYPNNSMKAKGFR